MQENKPCALLAAIVRFEAVQIELECFIFHYCSDPFAPITEGEDWCVLSRVKDGFLV